MKKLIALSIVLTVLASVAFAQGEGGGLSYGAWGRAVFAPLRMVAPEGDDSTVYTGVGKWSAYPRVGFSIKAEWENVGAQGDINFNEAGDNNIDVGDFAYIWAKPWDFLKISAGKFNDDTFRGKIGDTNFAGDITLGMKDNDAIFTRFQGNGLGAEIALTPIEGLYIAAEVNAGTFPGNSMEAKHAFQKIQVGAGYEIADIGHARVQFKGGNGTLGVDDKGTPGDDDDDTAIVDLIGIGVYAARTHGLPTADASRVELAFALTAVENLTVDLGAKIHFAAKNKLDDTTTEYKYDTKEMGDDTSYTNPLGISLGANYALGDFGILARVDTQIGAKAKAKIGGIAYEAKSGFYLNTHLVPSYNLGFATVGADIGFELNPTITSKTGDTSTTLVKGGVGFGLGAWIEKGLASGSIKTGIGVTLPTTTHTLLPDSANTAVKSPMVLTIPIIMEYWL
jgi:hypothetical protein